MSSLAILFLCGCLAILAAGKAAPPVYAPEDAELHFQRFIEEYAKNYSDESEYQARFQIFKDNLELANRMNEQSDHATFGITQFMDLTSEEFINSYTGLRIPQVNLTGCNRVTESEIAYVNAPDSHDWRQYGAVTRVKNQKSCGGCYAFSATGNIEGQYAIKHQQLAELSEQQIIDCDRGSNGCYGGYMSAAFQTIIQQGGIESESTYPYREYQGTCHFTPGKAVVRLTGCNVYNIVSESTMAQLLYTTGPISIGVRASAFQAYNGGIMSDAFCSGGNVNHAVLLVGYGQEQGVSYWIVKNSWGTSWGEQGYFRMLRSPRSDSCGMLANTGLTASSIIL